MAKKDLGKGLDKLDSLKDKEFHVFGIRMTTVTLMATLTGVGTIIATLYGGFLIYQKVEAVANLNVKSFEQRMLVMETQMDETVEYTRDIKNGLRDDILRIEQHSDRNEDMVRKSIDDVRNMIDDAEARF